MPNPDLEKYIISAKEQKVPDQEIKTQLVKSGWSESDVNEALAPKPTNNVNLPPPPVPHFGMWVTFQYVILFISLYVSATALGGILHNAVTRFISDPLDETRYYSSGFDDFMLRGYLGAIIVAFPIFAFLFVVLKKQAIEKSGVRNLRARKILIYLTLVGTFIIMIGHLIGTVYGFLGGSVTTRSLAHLGVTFLVAGSIFFYLLNEVREDRKSS